MSQYVDGFVIPLKKDRIEKYRNIASQAGAIWKEHGALAYFEAVGDDLDNPMFPMRFPQIAACADDETVIFAWIVYASREHRDEVNAKVMADPRIHAIMDPNDPVMDCARMAYGGFRVIVEA
jgi:uncharacterized protein YbaA (DUF1428 family)